MDLGAYVQNGINKFRQAIGQGVQQVQQAAAPVAQAVTNEAQQLPQQAVQATNNFGSFLGNQIVGTGIPLPQTPTVGRLVNTGLGLTGGANTPQTSPISAFLGGQVQNIPHILSQEVQGANQFAANLRNPNPQLRQQATINLIGSVSTGGNEGAVSQDIVNNARQALSHNLGAMLGDVTREFQPEELDNAVAQLKGRALTGDQYTDNAIKLSNFLDATNRNLISNPPPGVGLSTSNIRQGEAGGEKGLDPQDIQKFGDMANPQEISQVYQQAAQNKPVLDNLMNNTAQQTGARVETNFKNPDTLAEKVVTKNVEDPARDYTPQDVNDVYRGRVIYPDKGTLYQGVSVFKKQAQQAGVQIAKESDFFKNPEDGYQGYHVDVKLPNGQTQEVQFHTEKSLAASLATHDFHAEYGDEKAPAAAEKQKAQLNHEIMDMPNPQARAISTQIEQKNAPLQDEAQAKAANEIQGNPEPLPWEQIDWNKPGQYEQHGTVPTQAAIKLKAKMGNFNPDLGVRPESEPPAGQTPGIMAQNPKLVAGQARLARFGAMQPVSFRANTLAKQADNVLKTSEDNLNFRRAMEDPSKLDEYANQSKNPKAFKQLAQDYSNFTDYVFNQLKDAKGKTNIGYVQDYFTHIWDLSKPGAQQIFDDLMSNIRNSRSPFNKERVFATINEGLEAGLQLKNPKVSQDILQYSDSMGRQIGASAFNARINELRPGGAIEGKGGVVPYNAKGQAFRQSNVPGNQGTFIAPELQQEMGRYNPSVFANNPITKTADTLNRTIKTWDLSFGGFHALKTTVRALTTNPQSIPRAIYNAILPSARQAYNQSLIRDGVIDYASKIGVTASGIGDLQGKALLPGKLNLVENSNKALFDGLIQTYKMETVRGMMKEFDLNNPEQLQQAQKMGAQINNVFGGINYEAIGRNKTVQQLLRFGVLASDFNEGKIRQIGTAFNPKDWSPGAMYARQTLFGEAAIFGIISIVGNYLAGNKNMNLQQLIQNAILNPNIPLPNNATYNNPRTGTPQTANLPSNDISDIYRAITNPNQFIQARGAQAPRLAAELYSGKDYYGQPLVTGNQQDNLLNRAIAIGKQTLPIPGVQAEKVIQGRETPTVAAINTLGARVTNNPNDPKVQQQQAYFNGLNQTAASLNVNDQKIFLGVLHPTTKDADGNTIVDKNVYTSPDKYETLLANPTVLAAEQGFQQSQPNHDPMWDLNPTQLRAFMQAEVISKNNPISGFSSSTDPQAQTVKALYATLPANFFTQRSAWFNMLPQSTTNNSLPQAPQMPAAISQFWQQYDQLPYGTGARSRALQSAEGIAALAFINQQQVFTNQQRADMGLPLLAQQSSSTSGSGTGSGSKSSYSKTMYGNFGYVNGKMIPRPRIPLVRINRGRLSYSKPKSKTTFVAKAKPLSTKALAIKLPHPNVKITKYSTGVAPHPQVNVQNNTNLAFRSPASMKLTASKSPKVAKLRAYS